MMYGKKTMMMAKAPAGIKLLTSQSDPWADFDQNFSMGHVY